MTTESPGTGVAVSLDMMSPAWVTRLSCAGAERDAAVAELHELLLSVARFEIGRDTTPPTAPHLIYYQGYNCGQLIVGMMSSTDNVTPQSQLRYEVFADGTLIGPAPNTGGAQVWAWFQNDVLTPGSHTITVKAEDAAGNWSARSNAGVVTGYAC